MPLPNTLSNFSIIFRSLGVKSWTWDDFLQQVAYEMGAQTDAQLKQLGWRSKQHRRSVLERKGDPSEAVHRGSRGIVYAIRHTSWRSRNNDTRWEETIGCDAT